MPKGAEQYRDGSNGCANYEEPTKYSFTSIDVLPGLIGRLWDDKAVDIIHALRPSGIRLVGWPLATIRNNSQQWRVTVYIGEDGTIQKIKQEVIVGCRQFENGHEASLYYEEGAVNLSEKCARLKVALHDAFRRPMGTVPTSAEEFYDMDEADRAEKRRERLGVA